MPQTKRKEYSTGDIRKAFIQYKRLKENGEETSIRKTSADFNIPPSTLQKYIDRGEDYIEAQFIREELKLLHEIMILRYSKDKADFGHAVTINDFKGIANVLVEDMNKYFNDSDDINIRFSRAWFDGFRKRHSELKAEKLKGIPKSEFEDGEYECFLYWFIKYNEKIKDFNLLPKNIYNLNETNFQVDIDNDEFIFKSIDAKNEICEENGYTEFISVLECINQTGDVIKPMVIFNDETNEESKITKQILKTNKIPNWEYQVNENESSSNSIGLEWLENVFIPEVKAGSNNDESIGLIMSEQLENYITPQFILKCYDSNIIPLYFPPTTNHMFQPLDHIKFKNFKMELIIELNQIKSNSNIIAFIESYEKLRKQFFKSINIKNSWQKSGLYPINPNIILDQTTIKNKPNPYNNNMNINLIEIDEFQISDEEMTEEIKELTEEIKILKNRQKKETILLYKTTRLTGEKLKKEFLEFDSKMNFDDDDCCCSAVKLKSNETQKTQS
ncbi:uncharacterized protein KGF55_001578 [Candida pseudojiufengensis]|uniref:uncharacterized protein n=1 Tax=Candida pseudojiufengensis TaxID=497109 RepID=UPI00222590A8|nr:uncharacterized protein KGF55_001578 [Candida pseudojiufengensis]KAI5965357.1 hypothetical protein KGF55_001578 [Candida pseudojiufengensis]